MKTEQIIENRKKKITNSITKFIVENKLFIAVLILAFAVRIYFFIKTMDQGLWWDTASYLSTAKRFGTFNPNMNNIWYARRGFLWVVITAISFLFGIGEIGTRLTTLFFSTGLVLVSYLLVKEYFSKQVAILSSVLMSFSWVLLFFTGRPMTSIPSSFFLLLALLFFTKGYVKISDLKGAKAKYMIAFGLFFGLAVFTRMQMLMYAPVFLIIALTKEKLSFLKNKQLWVSVGIFALVLIPVVAVYWSNYGNPVLDIANYYLRIGNVAESAGLTSVGTSWFKYFTDLPYALTSKIFYFFLAGVLIFLVHFLIQGDRIFKDRETRKRFLVILWIVIPLLFLGYISPYPEQRYIIAILPFLFAIAVLPLEVLRLSVKDMKINPNHLLLICLTVVLVLSYSSLTFGVGLTNNKLGSYSELKVAGDWLKENTNPEDLIIATSYPQISYYSERETYPASAVGNNPELRIETTREQFDEFVKNEQPDYLVLSVFQRDLEWVYDYPIERNLTPIYVIQTEQQPLLVIYKFPNE